MLLRMASPIRRDGSSVHSGRAKIDAMGHFRIFLQCDPKRLCLIGLRRLARPRGPKSHLLRL